MKKHIILFLSIAFCSFGQIKEEFDGLQVLFKAKNNAIHLRWAPNDFKTWELGLKNGYTVLRTTIKKGKKSFKTGIDEKKTSITPYSKDKWLETVKSIPQAKVITHYFYDDPITTADTAVINNAMKGRFAICMLVADFNPEVASGMGLYFVDGDVKEDEAYSYQIVLNQSQVSIKGKVLASLSTLIPEMQITDLLDIDFISNKTVLKWTLPTNTIYSAYHVERSDDDGVSFKQVTKTPHLPINTSEDANFTTYSDSVAVLYKNYIYRVKGIDPFGDLGIASNQKTVFAFNTELIGAQNVKHSFTPKGEVKLQWTYPDSLKINIKGFDIYKTNGTEEPVKINKNTLTSPLYEYLDPIDPLDEVLYYFVDAIDLRNRNYRSDIYSVTIIDSISPRKVKNLMGDISKEGVVTLCWDKNSEKDLYSYNVMMAEGHSRNDFYLYKTILKRDTTYIDTLAMSTDNPKVHFLLVAVDNHTNYADNSDTLTLVKPDIKPPHPPTIESAYYTDSTLVLQWIPSFSYDVLFYNLYRKALPDTNRLKILSFSTRNWVGQYIDTTFAEGSSNEYILEAIDGAGLTSGDLCSRVVNVKKPYIRSPLVNLFGNFIKKEKKININWSYKCKVPVEKFSIFRKDSPNGDFKKIKEIDGNVFYFIDENIPEKSQIFYKIFAFCNDDTRSSEGKIIEIKTN